MTPEELESVVARHEMQRLELKESFDVECIETACAFANAGGGFVVIGVDDHGAPSKHQLRSEGLRDYENKISTATEPSVAVDAEKVMFAGREVIVLKVMENPLKPVAYKGRCYVRKGSVNHQMTPAEIAECHLKSTGGSMDAVFVPGVTRDDLDMEAVRRYMRKSVKKGRRAYAEDEDPWEVLVKLEWVRSESEITRAAYLLFAKDPQRKFSQAIIHAGAFKANGVEIIDSRDCKGNIQDQVDEAIGFIKRNIRCAIVNTPGKADHDSVWDYPIEALRETLANAVCHRDYGSPHDIQLKIYEKSISISSPGQLPFDMPMELLMSPTHASRPRNRLIAQALYDMGVIEHYGRGIKRIKEECDSNGNAYPEWTDRAGEFLTEYHAREIKGVEVGGKGQEIGGKGTEVGGKGTEVGGKGQDVGGNIDFNVALAGVRKDFRETCHQVWELLLRDENLHQQDVCARLQMADSSVRSAYAALKDAGLLIKEGKGRGSKWIVVRPPRTTVNDGVNDGLNDGVKDRQ